MGSALEVISNIITAVEARVILRQWASCFVTEDNLGHKWKFSVCKELSLFELEMWFLCMSRQGKCYGFQWS